MRIRTYLTFLVVWGLITLAGCKREDKYGKALDANLPYETVGSVLANPAQFLDKEVALKGKIVKECGSGCWFYLDDGTGSIYVDLAPGNFAIPQRTGRVVMLKGKVMKDEERIVVHASGVQF